MKENIETKDVQRTEYLDKNGLDMLWAKVKENINNYALKSELPTVPTKVSQLQNDSEFIAKSVYDEKIAALEARIAALEAKHWVLMKA